MKSPTRFPRLSSAQRGALLSALAGSITANRYSAEAGRNDNPPKRTAETTIEVLLRHGLVEKSRFEVAEYVATRWGTEMGRHLGVKTKPVLSAPKSLRERAMRLRELTMPDVWACGDREAYEPRLMREFVGHDNRWIEALGYGRFEVLSDRRCERHLALSAKGQKLVSATDTPITVRLSDEMARHLAAGDLQKVIVPDPKRHRPRLANFQMLKTDPMRSRSDTWARMYDPAAIFPGTPIHLVHAKTGKRLATARAGAWDRLTFRHNVLGGAPIFDVTYEYSAAEELDKYDRRIWVPFPYAKDSLAPCEASHQLARACGFDTINTMRKFWARRSPKGRDERGGGAVCGLIVELSDVQSAA